MAKKVIVMEENLLCESGYVNSLGFCDKPNLQIGGNIWKNCTKNSDCLTTQNETGFCQFSAIFPHTGYCMPLENDEDIQNLLQDVFL